MFSSVSTSVNHSIDVAVEPVLRAMAETFYPPLTSDASADSFIDTHLLATIPHLANVNRHVLRRYLTYRAHEHPDLVPFIRAKMALAVVGRVQLLAARLILLAMSHWLGVFVLSLGSSKQAFPQMTRHDRESMLLHGWMRHRHGPLRGLCRLLHALTSTFIYGHVDSSGQNPTWPAIGYAPIQAVDDKNGAKLSQAIIQLPQATSDTEQSEIFDYDVIIIGSGAGGGVAAANLSAAGHRVLVCEKGSFNRAPNLAAAEETAYAKLYEKGGMLASRDGSCLVLAGSTFGGGTTVNWSASLEPPQHVRQEWARQGLPHFATEQFQTSLDTVCQRMGVHSAHIRHNGPNTVLMEGCQLLNDSTVKPIPQNTGNKHHPCGGQCSLGCPTAAKMGSMETFMRDAAANGAKFLCNSHVTKILRDKATGAVRGVEARVQGNSRKVTVDARCVVVSCGSVQTPALLLRSGFRNRHIGRNLKLHPVRPVAGFFPSRLIDPAKGSMMTVVANWPDSDGGSTDYGTKLEVPAALPMLVSSMLPYINYNHGGSQHSDEHDSALRRSQMLKYRHLSPIVVLQRDMDSVGRVSVASDGEPLIDYRLSRHDAESLMRGIVRALDVLVAAGASEVASMLEVEEGIFTFNSSVDGPCYSTGPPNLSDPAYRQFTQRLLQLQLKSPQNCSVSSAHQMGSCRLGQSPNQGACRPTGQLWECDGVWVCDASVFSTASGVNPMLTTMACADMISRECGHWLKSA